MKKLFKKLFASYSFPTHPVGRILFVALFLIMGILATANVFATSAQIGGQANGYQCLGGEAARWKIETDNSATLPSGYSIETVVVKAGQDCVSVYSTNTAPTCYSVALNGTTVTVTKIGSGSTCKDISHLEGTYSIDVTPTPTTITPTVTPTPTPTETPTGTPTPTPDNTSIVQSSVGGSDGRSDGRSDGLGGQAPAAGQVLGASTMADTGSFGSLISKALFALGLTFTTLASAGHAKKKK